MMKSLSKTFLTGLITILPVFLTAYLLYWLAVSAESWLGNPIRMALPAHWYWPGMGLVAGLGVVFVVGLLMHAYVVQRLFAMAEEMLYHVPLIKSVYRAIRDFTFAIPDAHVGVSFDADVFFEERGGSVGLVLAETSTGAWQPIADIADLNRQVPNFESLVDSLLGGLDLHRVVAPATRHQRKEGRPSSAGRDPGRVARGSGLPHGGSLGQWQRGRDLRSVPGFLALQVPPSAAPWS